MSFLASHRNLIGVLLCGLLFSSGFFIHGNAGLYVNLAGLIIVLSGTAGATLISYRLERLVIVYRVLLTSYRTQPRQPDELIEILVDLSVKSRFEGIVSLQHDEEETSILFLRQALGLLVDGFHGQQIREMLNAEMYFFRMRREDCERVLRSIADYFPSFGMAGSVVGLIGMLAGVGDTTVILAMVPIALTSTLYGIILSNFLFLPFAAHLRERTDHELLVQKIILEGVVAIEGEVNPRVLERKLKAFLTPAARSRQMLTMRKIRERFHKRAMAQGGTPAQPVSPETTSPEGPPP
ncbi:MAG: MotA/TolQ/ExbB proton channel family protein [Thermodesulfobacteriota bacterium]